MMRKILWLCAALAVAAGTAWSATWEGSAVVGGIADFPGDGLYASCNSFPKGSLVEVKNLENGKTIQLRISGGVDNPGVFMALSPKAAQELGIRPGNAGRIRAAVINQTAAPLTPSPHTSGGESADPDFNLRLLAAGAGKAAAPETKPAPPPAKPEPPKEGAQILDREPQIAPTSGSQAGASLPEAQPTAPAEAPAASSVSSPAPQAPEKPSEVLSSNTAAPAGSATAPAASVGAPEPPAVESPSLVLGGEKPASPTREAGPAPSLAEAEPSALSALEKLPPDGLLGREGSAGTAGPVPEEAAAQSKLALGSPEPPKVESPAVEPRPEISPAEASAKPLPVAEPAPAQPESPESAERVALPLAQVQPEAAGEASLVSSAPEAQPEAEPSPGSLSLAGSVPAEGASPALPMVPDAAASEPQKGLGSSGSDPGLGLAWEPSGAPSIPEAPLDLSHTEPTVEEPGLSQVPKAGGAVESEDEAPSEVALSLEPTGLRPPERRPEPASIGSGVPGVSTEGPAAAGLQGTGSPVEQASATAMSNPAVAPPAPSAGTASAVPASAGAPSPAVASSPAAQSAGEGGALSPSPVSRPPIQPAAASQAQPRPGMPPLVQSLNPGSYYVQVAVLSSEAAVVDMAAKFPGFPLSAQKVEGSKGISYRFYIGPLKKDEGGTVLLKLKTLGFRDAFLRQAGN